MCWALGIDAGGGDWEVTVQESTSLRQQGHAARWGREKLVLGQEELFARTAQASAKLALIKVHKIKRSAQVIKICMYLLVQLPQTGTGNQTLALFSVQAPTATAAAAVIAGAQG